MMIDSSRPAARYSKKDDTAKRIYVHLMEMNFTLTLINWPLTPTHVRNNVSFRAGIEFKRMPP